MHVTNMYLYFIVYHWSWLGNHGVRNELEKESQAQEYIKECIYFSHVWDFGVIVVALYFIDGDM